jgi:hypothetical protein
MAAAFVSLTRKMTLQAAEVKVITFEVGAPYRNYTAWVAVAGKATINVSVQPLFGGASDGSATAFAAVAVKKVYQVADDEMRPQTSGINRHPDDDGPPNPVKSEVQITNSGANPAEVSVYLIALT